MRLILAFLILAPFVSLLVNAQETAGLQIDEKRYKLMVKELERRDRMIDWVRKAKPSQEEIAKYELGPVLQGNSEDFKRNMELAQKYRSRAEDVSRKGQDEKAKEYMQVGSLFYAIAQANKSIVESLQKKDFEALQSGYDTIVVSEKEIKKLAGKLPPRAWFTPEELAAASKRKRALEQAEKQE